jgi:hypothetical protein
LLGPGRGRGRARAQPHPWHPHPGAPAAGVPREVISRCSQRRSKINGAGGAGSKINYPPKSESGWKALFQKCTNFRVHSRSTQDHSGRQRPQRIAAPDLKKHAAAPVKTAMPGGDDRAERISPPRRSGATIGLVPRTAGSSSRSGPARPSCLCARNAKIKSAGTVGVVFQEQPVDLRSRSSKKPRGRFVKRLI